MNKFITCIFFLFVHGIWAQQRLYSRFLKSTVNPCTYCSNHIACNSTWEYDEKCYPNVNFFKMTPEMRDLILDLHNGWRNYMAGGAVPGYNPAMRMASMKWNEEFEYLAALNLLQCQMAHDKCRRTPDYPYVGQNLAYLKWKGYNFTTEEVVMFLISYWFKEYENANQQVIDELKVRPAGSPLVGHFLMMVQERADLVGCSILQQISKDGLIELYLACDYSFANIYTVKVYRSGKPGSGCQTGVNSIYTSLCSNNEKYNRSTHKY